MFRKRILSVRYLLAWLTSSHMRSCISLLVPYDFDMDIIDALFVDANVVSTRHVARAFDLSESDARDWADQLDVAKVGASFAWARPDAERLAEALENEDESEDEEDEEEDESEDEEDE